MPSPEIQRLDNDVFDPAGGDRLYITGRNLATPSLVLVGPTPATNVKEIAGVPSFNGTTTRLTTATTLGSFVGGSAWSFVALVRAGAQPATVTPDGDPKVFSDTGGYLSLQVNSDGARIYAFSGAQLYSRYVPLVPGTLALICGYWDGARIYISVNGGSFDVGTACGALSNTTGAMRVGCNYGSTSVFNGDEIELMFSAANLSANFTNIVAYINNRYGTNFGGVAASAFDPATLALTGWWRSGGYVAGTWSGVGSAGPSGSRNLTEATNPPAVAPSSIVCTMPAGSATSTVTVAPFPSFDGINKKLGNGLAISNYFGASTGGFVVLVRPPTKNATAPVTNDANIKIFGDAGSYIGLMVYDDVAQLYVFGTGAIVAPSVAIKLPRDKWSVLRGKWDGTNIFLQLDDVPFGAGLAGTGPSNVLGSLRVGTNYNATSFFQGGIRELFLMNGAPTDAEFTNIVGYLNARYNLTLIGARLPSFDPSTITKISGWWRAGDYTSGTWSAAAGAGTWAGRNLTEATNIPAVTTSETSPALYPVTVVASAGIGTLAKAVQYANPKTVSDCIWWLRPDATAVTRNGVPEVTVWADQSGVGDAGRNATNGASGDKPSWNASDPDYGGKPTVGTFNKAGAFGDCRLVTGTWNTTYLDTTGYQIGVVGHSVITGNRYFVFEQNSDYNALVNGSGTPIAYGYNSTPNIASVGNPSNPRTFFSALFNAAASKLYTESRAPDGGDLKGAGPGDTLGDAPMNVGSYYSTATSFGVERIAEVYAYSRGLTLREVRTLRRYRDSYYGANP